MKSRAPQRIALAVVILLFLASGCATAPEKPETIYNDGYAYLKAHLTWEIGRQMKAAGVVGLSIALVDDRQVIWSRGFGFADKAGKHPADSETVYRIGSISKVFTAMGVMQLKEAGRIDLDAPLRTYLPGFSINSRFGDTDGITPRNIMTHHSGLPCDIFRGWTSEPDAALLPRLAQANTAYPPDFVFAYSNAGVSLLGLMIESMAGLDFSDHMRQAMFGPMGMPHTSYTLDPHMAQQLSKGYFKGREGKQLPIRDRAAGSVYSNVQDMSRFMRIILNQGRSQGTTVFSPRALDEMLQLQNRYQPLDFGFPMGLGWILGGIRVPGARQVIWHNGGTFHFNSHMVLLPKKKLGVVILSNSSEAGNVIRQLGTQALKIALETKHRSGPTGSKTITKNKDRRQDGFSPSRVQDLVGDYGTPGGIITISAKRNALTARMNGEKFRLVPYTDGSIGIEKRILGFIPLRTREMEALRFSHKTVAGYELVLAHYGGQAYPMASKINPVPIPDRWKAMAGEYEPANPDPNLNPRQVRLTVDEKALILSFALDLPMREASTVYFQPLSVTEAITMGIGRNAGETMRIIDIDGRPGIYYSGFKLRRSAE